MSLDVRRGLVGSLLGAVLFLGACLPWPHYSQYAPEVEGVVSRGGVPVEGASVWFLSNEDPMRVCHPGDLPPKHARKTDAQGRFRGERAEQFEWFVVMGDRRDFWTACFFLDDGARFYYTETGWWGGPPKQLWRCEVQTEDAPQEPVGLEGGPGFPPGTRGSCAVQDVR